MSLVDITYQRQEEDSSQQNPPLKVQHVQAHTKVVEGEADSLQSEETECSPSKNHSVTRHLFNKGIWWSSYREFSEFCSLILLGSVACVFLRRQCRRFLQNAWSKHVSLLQTIYSISNNWTFLVVRNSCFDNLIPSRWSIFKHGKKKAKSSVHIYDLKWNEM